MSDLPHAAAIAGLMRMRVRIATTLTRGWAGARASYGAALPPWYHWQCSW